MSDEEFKEQVKDNFLAIKELRIAQAENAKQFAKDMQALRASQEKTDEQLKKTDEQLKKTDGQLTRLEATVKETSRKVGEVARRFGDSENTKGKMTEVHFYQYLKKHLRLNGIRFTEVHQGLYSRDRHEHDIVMLDAVESRAAAVSVKHKLTLASVRHLIEQELPRLKGYLKAIKGIDKIYLVAAGFIVEEEAQDYANRQGIYVMTQSGDNTEFINSEDFTPAEW